MHPIMPLLAKGMNGVILWENVVIVVASVLIGGVVIVWSSLWAQGPGPARALCAFSGSEFRNAYSDDTRGHVMKIHGSLCFYLSSSVEKRVSCRTTVLGTKLPFPFPTTSCSLEVVSDTRSLIVTPPTGARPCGRKAGSKLSLIAHSMSASSPSPSPFS
ncbi:hypothetical protein Tco_1067657 [Tanacetum coccineum]|uniref:Uncharacterized protein n=1 Tax=Tanacetum coccineum TaxID=301880 RepID=A0ABQ5HDH3_9ASTR